MISELKCLMLDGRYSINRDDENKSMYSTKNIFKCRLCESIKINDLLELSGFPKSAQHFLNDLNDIEVEADIAIELQVSQCITCGLVQLKNDPVAYFKDVITAASLSEGSKSTLVNEWTPFIDKYSLNGKLAIEIGSGKGDFLEVLSRLGLICEGLEHSRENIEFSNRKGFIAKQGYLLDQYDILEKEKYSLVVCNNFLEHQPQTKSFISYLHSLLNDDGVIYISVPNLDYLLQKSCLYEFVADHLVYFTESSLKLAFEMNSFEVLEQYKKNNGNDLVLVAKKKKLLDLSNHKKNVELIIDSVKKIVLKADKAGLKIGVWGAGHRALALMVMARIEKISFVVDSASFKQGKFTPILHKKIISPEEFLTINCDLLIIMLPGNYSGQVKKFLLENNCKCKLLFFEDQELILND